MSVKITNTSSTQRLVRLSSGLTRRLAPGESVEVEAVEVKNRRVRRLVQARAIALEEGESRKGVGSEGRRSRDMSASEAAEFIAKADESDLKDFLSPDEDRVTVLRAMEEREAG